MSVVWIFVFCILDGSVCDIEQQIMPDYDSCVEAQEQLAEDHRDEDYLSLCKRIVEIRT